MKVIALPGRPALSQFGLRRQQERTPGVCYAEYVHVLNLEGELDDDKLGRVENLLRYGPTEDMPEPCGKRLATVMPRRGTISPWSSKATDIFGICGLPEVIRVERGVRWFVSEGASREDVRAEYLYDRMTEELFTEEAFESTFHQQDPQPLERLPLLADGVEALERANTELGMALSDDEIEYLAEAYRNLDRDPTDVELMMFAQANSEHCRHKIFNADWVIDGTPQSGSLFGMIRNTHKQTNGRGILSAYSDNAAVIEGHQDARWWVDPHTHRYGYVNEPVHVLMKVETHNHPTAIAPFPGAATGSGGEIRDEGAVGRGSKPKAGLTGFTTSHLNIPGLPQPWELDTGKPGHTASALDIMLEGPIGGASFNNEYGRPAINGYFRTMEIEHAGQIRGYHKPIMIAGGVGTVREEHVHHTMFRAGTALVVLGGPAMLIGLGGGAASSMASGASHSDLDFASVQRGNPEMERRCQEVIDACCALGGENPIQLIHDVGAGGMSNALPELVKDGGAGGQFELRHIPNADPGMSPLEIWCNEAQERYVLGIDADRLDVFEAFCQRERCPYAVVGRATGDDTLRVTDSHFEDHPVDLPMEVLFGKPPKMTRTFDREALTAHPLELADVDLGEAVSRVLQFPAVASKKFLITIGDRSITGMVACQPMIGPWQTPVADLAVTIRGFSSYRGEAFSMGERIPLALVNPAASARMAVGEALTNLVAADVDALDRVVLSANWMAASGPNAEEQALYEAVQAVGEEFCPALGIAVPVGKDSLSMQMRWQAEGEERKVVAPVSLIVSAFATVEDVRKTLTPVLQSGTESSLLLLHLGEQRLGGSTLAQVYGQIGDTTPDADGESLREMLQYVRTLANDGIILAMHDRSDGGLLTTVLEMAFAARCGVDIDAGPRPPLDWLFNEELGIVIQVPVGQAAVIVHQAPCAVDVVGRVREDEVIRVNGQDGVLYENTRAGLERLWSLTSHALQRIRDNADCADEELDLVVADRLRDPGISAGVNYDVAEDVALPFINTERRPAIAVLREQGVNGQLEMAAAFDRAGFDCTDVHMSDLIEQRHTLEDFQALVACGGFSYGDVLGGGGGWAKSVLYNPSLRDQFESFFQDHLVLGVCNGCQMLAQLAELIPGAEGWPLFVRNRSEQFEGRMVMTRVVDGDSPWLTDMGGSVLPVAVAHGEGRAEFSGGTGIDMLIENRQVAFQYVDGHHEVTEVYPYNPNGAAQGLAGITANEGRVLAMMPHPERVFRTCQNVWQDPSWGEDGPWMRLFRNARVALD